jgi:hypothetical protein
VGKSVSDVGEDIIIPYIEERECEGAIWVYLAQDNFK